MASKGKKLLKISGGLSMLIGFVVIFVGFYVMANGMAYNSTTADIDETALKTMKYLSAGGIYLMAFGGMYIYSGFVGLMNAADYSSAIKLRNYGMVCFGLCILNMSILLIASDMVTILNVAIVIIPMAVSLMYIIGALLNKKTNSDTEIE